MTAATLSVLSPLSSGFVLPLSFSQQARYSPVAKTTSGVIAQSTDMQEMDNTDDSSSNGFDLNLALFCGGLAFDAYQEPPMNSSRWEKGSKGLNVAFLSQAFTRGLYKGMLEVTPLRCSGLPDEDDGLESLMSGGGVDASIMVAVVEGNWKEDIELLKKEYHEGILDLTGAAHIGKSSTAWSNVDESKSMLAKKKTGKALPYHVKKSWGKDAAAVWPEDDPFYLYIQDPANAQLLFTLFDDDVIGEGSAIGSTYVPLATVVPQVSYTQDDIIAELKTSILKKIERGEIEPDDIEKDFSKVIGKGIQSWEGDLKLRSKPRIKNKNSQIALAAAAGGMVAGPVGAALGAAVGSLYEGQVKGRIRVRLRYLPIPDAPAQRNRYIVKGGMPGIDWGSLYQKYLAKHFGFNTDKNIDDLNPAGQDLEHCFFIDHSETGGCCAVYRSLEKKLIVISFRGTCTLKDVATDASIAISPWVEGDDPNDPAIAKVHVGFRRSLNSISRRLKELILAAVAPGDDISDYNILVTGHSLGGALATLFTADIAEYGIDAGRALPTSLPASDAWWKAIANTFMGNLAQEQVSRQPPRPKTLRVYNFGSPRVGNKAFSNRFEELLKAGKIDQAYRIVNDKDVVARMPRTMGALSVDYDHCGSTVLVQAPTQENPAKVLWVEGESDDKECPVRDYQRMMASPTAEGSLLGDLLKALNKEGSDHEQEKTGELLSQIGAIASKFQERLLAVTASDLTTLIGIDKTFTEREIQMVQALFKGEALAHHMEDSYYSALGSAGGFVAVMGRDIVPADDKSVELLSSSDAYQRELSALEGLVMENPS